jgi:membrane-associated phospholipid phosphatase
MVTLAVLNGVGRVITENHYATDVLIAAALGSVAGWLVPELLHYGSHPEGPAEDPDPSADGAPAGLRLSMLPLLSNEQLGITILAVH